MATSNFQINNAELLRDQAQQLMQLSQNILRVQEELTTNCNKISSAWGSDTADRESYLKELEVNLQKIGVLTQAGKQLGNSLLEFAESAIRTANNG